MSSVLKPWVSELPFRMQAVLMASLRGCDTAKKNDCSKFITRALRVVCMHNADPTNTYMVGDGTPNDTHVHDFLDDLDSYPLHFAMHTMHAAEIVGYKHNENAMKLWWIKFYQRMVRGLHVNPETESQLNVRLGPTLYEESIKEEIKQKQLDVVADDVEKKVVDSMKWDAGTGTSHGRDYS